MPDKEWAVIILGAAILVTLYVIALELAELIDRPIVMTMPVPMAKETSSE